ncbi:hypothetical protein [Phormidium nigroviride]
MAFIRQYVAPLIAVIIFFLALAAVSARIFLPNDMAAPAPIEEVSPQARHAQTPTLNVVVGSGESIAIAH